MNVDHHVSESAKRGTRRRSVLAGVLAVAAVVSMLGVGVDSAQAASNPSVTIDGLGTFSVLSYSWGSTSGSGQSGPNSKVRDLSFVKLVDGLSPALSSAVASGQTFATASITIDSKNGKPTRYEMTSVLITAVSVGSSTPTGDVTENVSLHFTSVKAVHR